MSYKKYREFCLKHKDNPDVPPDARAILKYSLSMEVCDECRECAMLYLHGGKCQGRFKAKAPCLTFKKNNVVDIGDLMLDKKMSF